MDVGGVSVNVNGRPPSGSHFELYAISANRSFHLRTFQVTGAVDLASPCAIESASARFPLYDGPERPAGLHVTAWRDKLLELYEADGGIDDAEAGMLVTAERRLADLEQLEEMRVVASHPFGRLASSPSVTEFRAELAEVVAAGPTNDQMDEASNRERMELCESLFARFPDWYQGNDRVLTQPLNGELFGVVTQTDPRNQAAIGGADFTTHLPFPADLDAVRINWQFDDPEDPRAEGYGGLAPNGYHYLAGVPDQRTRATLTVDLANERFVSINAQATLFPNLDEDEVHF